MDMSEGGNHSRSRAHLPSYQPCSGFVAPTALLGVATGSFTGKPLLESMQSRDNRIQAATTSDAKTVATEAVQDVEQLKFLTPEVTPIRLC